MDNVATESSEVRTAPRCGNCAALLQGEHCHVCGQPTRGLVRHFSTLFGDFVDSAFNLDSRTLRTLLPLLLRPGFLSIEYFAGRRVRYVSPVRLFFFTSILAFLALRFSVDLEGSNALRFDDGAVARIEAAATVDEVARIRDGAVAGLDEAIRGLGEVPGAAAAMQAGRSAILQAAEARNAALREADATGVAPPPPPPPQNGLDFGNGPWNANSNPLLIHGLPAAVNSGLNRWIGRAEGNIERLRNNPQLLADAFIRAVPQTLFVLLPLFALLLKLAYTFQRRLYMEHLIIALHSHAFLCLTLLLMALLEMLRAGLQPGVSRDALGAGGIALLCWMPLYLLIMQKRVYRQSWIMTLLKYSVLGVCYMVLISLGAVGALLFSLVAM